jgi:hypothetical protein
MIRPERGGSGIFMDVLLHACRTARATDNSPDRMTGKPRSKFGSQDLQTQLRNNCGGCQRA